MSTHQLVKSLSSKTDFLIAGENMGPKKKLIAEKLDFRKSYKQPQSKKFQIFLERNKIQTNPNVQLTNDKQMPAMLPIH